jgi:hypothetical protein
VKAVSFTARLPNPEPKDAFRDLAERMEKRHATTYVEELLSDQDEGLVGVEDDRDIRQAIAMGEHGLATLRGRQRRLGIAICRDAPIVAQAPQCPIDQRL